MHESCNFPNPSLYNVQNYVPMQSMLPSEATAMNQADSVNHPPSNYANQLVAESKSYATLQSIELSRGEYQKLNK